MGPTWGPSGADRTQVGPCWPHGPCYLGRLTFVFISSVHCCKQHPTNKILYSKTRYVYRHTYRNFSRCIPWVMSNLFIILIISNKWVFSGKYQLKQSGLRIRLLNVHMHRNRWLWHPWDKTLCTSEQIGWICVHNKTGFGLKYYVKHRIFPNTINLKMLNFVTKKPS